MTLNGRVSIITGSARGIGKRIAQLLASGGAAVVISDADESQAQATAREIETDFGGKTACIPADISQIDHIHNLVNTTVRQFERIDILVNNAGICPLNKIEDITLEEWNRVLSVNLTGVFFCCQAVMSVMKKQGSGNILNLASIAGKIGGIAAGAHYSASKAGVICLTKVFARAMAPFGVRVNAIAPGPVNTDMVKGFSEESMKILVEQAPLRRIADVDDIAEAALFLVSDAAKHITGEILDINGGLLMD
ncbi:MAG: SDR family oxidoreductase [Deltaproteobacteria bacterium]|nr:SDR family oxidoreductase [Deltaproteobacteria bacterium]MBW1960289.1 SDR family oxidoreductase [Deltaproteobacteria bacterium]MBW1994232.1 SDR family oxidoreductase [Deltaproteobacteria bacterium]MBW2150297.1 SDR family oxidoreductase [Deltaproteobacteria bacterium]